MFFDKDDPLRSIYGPASDINHDGHTDMREASLYHQIYELTTKNSDNESGGDFADDLEDNAEDEDFDDGLDDNSEDEDFDDGLGDDSEDEDFSDDLGDDAGDDDFDDGFSDDLNDGDDFRLW